MSREIVTKNIVHGDLGAFGTRPGVVIGERLRQALNVRAGDKVTLVTHKLNENGTIAPRYTDYELLASFLTRRYEFDGALVFVPLPMLQDDLEYGDQAVSSIDLDIADPAAAPRVAEELRKALGRDDLKVADWLGLNARFVGALQVERVMMFIILTLIVVVAAMNVVASFTMLVRVKRGSIAILRTMGASPRHHRARLLHVGRRRRPRRHRRRHRARPAGLRQHAVDRRAAGLDHRGGGQRLGRGRFHHLHAGAGAAGRSGDGHRRRDRAVAGGGRLSGLAQHAGRTGRRTAA